MLLMTVEEEMVVSKVHVNIGYISRSMEACSSVIISGQF